MKKNIPITERINAGLFKQKGLKVTEPLLNVGPAGVFGRAETRDIPSPSKMKRGYSMKPSPLKQTATDKPKVKDDKEVTRVIKSKTVQDAKETAGKNTPDVVTKRKYVGAANDACSAEYIKKNGKAACTEYNNLPKEKKDAANTKTVKGKKKPPVKTCEPGFKMVDGKCEKTVTEEKKVYTRDQGDTMTAIERSNSERAGKRSNRRVKGSQRKIDKANRKSGAINPDTGKAYDKKKQRNARNLAEAKANNKMLKASSAGALAQTKSNRSIRARKTGTVKSASRVADKGQDSSLAAVAAATDKKNTGNPRPGEENKNTNPRANQRKE
jgi:hypothetical protein